MAITVFNHATGDIDELRELQASGLRILGILGRDDVPSEFDLIGVREGGVTVHQATVSTAFNPDGYVAKVTFDPSLRRSEAKR